MKKHTVYTIPFRREMEEKTNYKTRLRLLLSNKPRLVVRLFSKNAIVQLVGYEPAGDKILASANSRQLVKSFGWKGNLGNISSAYLVGLLAAKNAKKAGVTEAVLDIGSQTSSGSSRIYAALKGALDGGLDIPHSEDILPSKERISGKHVADHAKLLKGKDAEYKKYFSAYLKAGLNPEEITQNFDSTKKKIEAI